MLNIKTKRVDARVSELDFDLIEIYANDQYDGNKSIALRQIIRYGLSEAELVANPCLKEKLQDRRNK